MAERTLQIIKGGGKISMSDDEIKRTLNFWLNDCFNGTYVLSLKRFSKPATDQQRKYMWAIFRNIADALSDAYGYTWTVENVHDKYCKMFIPVTLPDGTNIAGHTSDLRTTESKSEFITKVIAHAESEYGIQIPSPDDHYFALWAKKYGASYYFGDN